MSRRVEQINELFKGELAHLLNREIPLDNGLITISFVECSPDLRYAKIGVSVLPDNLSGTALKKIKKYNKLFSQELKKKLALGCIPRFNWTIDGREKQAAEIEKILKKI